MKTSLEISQLVIEVTRKCNLACAHCLRGNAENQNIKLEYIDKLLSQTNYINTVTFAGGEPSLNVEALEYFLKQVNLKNIGVGNFYIATNGVNTPLEFIIFCLKMYGYCDEKELCSVQVSNDAYHAAESRYSTELLGGLSFFSRRNATEASDIALIAEGKANEYGLGGRANTSTEIVTKDDLSDTEIYLNAKGKLINGCNWSYLSQIEHELCDVSELSAFYNSLDD